MEFEGEEIGRLQHHDNIKDNEEKDTPVLTISRGKSVASFRRTVNAFRCFFFFFSFFLHPSLSIC